MLVGYLIILLPKAGRADQRAVQELQLVLEQKKLDGEATDPRGIYAVVSSELDEETLMKLFASRRGGPCY
jgi:hypothetical protein